MVLVRILERCGATCLKACSGEEGIDAAVRHIGEIDLVLMDRQMPDIDGCEAAEAIRNIEGGKEVPIIALTAGATTLERERASASGMNDFCIKPVKPGSLSCSAGPTNCPWKPTLAPSSQGRLQERRGFRECHAAQAG